MFKWNRVFSLRWPASIQIYWNKRKRLHKKRVQLPQDWFGTPTLPPFHCFRTPIWPTWRHVKTLYKNAIHRVISRNCSQIFTNEGLLAVYIGMLRRARERHEGELAEPNETRRKISKLAPEEIPLRLTRSKRSPFSRDKCFFRDASESRGKAFLLFPVLLLPSPYVLQFWKRPAPL